MTVERDAENGRSQSAATANAAFSRFRVEQPLPTGYLLLLLP